MKRLFLLFEDLWVAVAFAEAGAYETLRIEKPRPLYRETISMRAA
jgi:hypothetical protein